ncbi:MAG: isoprenyl transferase [Bacteroidales bacterium]|nr:isoprenyl transferase [Bacteroidales bacterium]MDY0216701.1 isoprenyl transferase [Bacteroidales bacterium]
MSFKNRLDRTNIPKHVAIIMDGNGRWAEKHKRERTFGHQNGIKAVRQAIEGAAEIGIEFLTLYAFSTENWNRPKEEVDMLMDLMVQAIESESKEILQNNVRIKTIGDIDRLMPETLVSLQDIIKKSSKNTGLTVVIALSYSSRWEIVEMVKVVAEKVKNNEILAKNITEKTISEHLSTHFMPDPELIIRTSAEKRLSNFLMWQASYSEFAFIETLWPDFTKETLFETISDFQQRERRFGKTGKQVKDEQ